MQPSYTIAIALFLLCQTAMACPDEKNCRSCRKTGSPEHSDCMICENSFFDEKNKKCNDNLPVLVPNCDTYLPPNNPYGICLFCHPGYEINEDYDTCVRCTDENCAYCKGKTCLACFNGFLTRDDGTCDTNSKCEIENCSICANSSPLQCFQCSPGYVGFSSPDPICVKGPSNCLRMISTGDRKCAVCSYGYYILSDGSCKSDAEIHRISLDVDQGVSGLFNLLADALVPVM